ncbi:MAG TPA: J domain-containing protein [Polyangiaceae bacterium]|nr:J domain-containing protein [Polyangiaceae bacterium]
MHLQGQLRLTTLGDLLGALWRERMSGTLELTEERGVTSGRVHCLHLVEGLIVQVDTAASAAHVGEILVDEGWINRAQLDQLIAEARDSTLPFGRHLVVAGLLPSTAVLAALRAQLQKRLDVVFQLEDARVAFRLTRSRRRELDVEKPLLPEDYLVGRPRARDRGHSRARRAGNEGIHGDTRHHDLRLLGLGPSADERTIRSAFRRLARMVHPDLHPTAEPKQLEDLRRRFADLSAAYHRLAG